MSIFSRRKLENREKERFSDKKKSSRIQVKKRGKKTPELWDKKDRFLVLGVLLATILLSGVLALSARSWKLPGLPAISFPSFEGKTIIIERDRGRDREKAEEVIKAFKEETRKFSGVYGLYVMKLDSGFSYAVSEREIFQAASLIKLPAIAALYIEAEKGNVDLETKYRLKEGDKRFGAGSLSAKPEGTVLTYRDLARLMGKQSDNTAFNIIRQVLGDERIDEVAREIGMLDTSLEENETTTRDVGIFFEKLWQGDIVSDKSRDEILGFLTNTTYEEWLVAGIPSNVRVAHKFGRETHVVNDAGIVFTDKPFILVIMSKGVVEREADEVFPELARIVYGVETGE